MVISALQNRPNCVAKQAVRQCETARFATSNGTFCGARQAGRDAGMAFVNKKISKLSVTEKARTTRRHPMIRAIGIHICEYAETENATPLGFGYSFS